MSAPSRMIIAIALTVCLAISGCSSVPTSEPAISTTTTTATTSTAPPTPTPSPTPQPTITPSPTATPTPTIVPTPTIAPELDGIPAARLQFAKDLLEIYDNSLSTNDTCFNKVDDYITREQIIEYGKTGTYSNIENFAIIMHKDGTPAIAMINCKDNVVSSFKTAIKEMEVYDPNYLKVLTSNGMRAFMVNRFNPNGSSTYTFNKSGLVVWNAEDKVLAKDNVAYALKMSIETESFGIKMYQLGGDYSKYVGFMKELLSSDCWWNLYMKNSQYYCEEASKSSYIQSIFYYNDFYAPTDMKSTFIQSLLTKIREQNLATPFGGTWDEITQNIKERPDWDRAYFEKNQ